MAQRTNIFEFKINNKLFNFVNNDVLKVLNIEQNHFWSAFSKVCSVLNV